MTAGPGTSASVSSRTARAIWLAGSKSAAYALNLAVPLLLVRSMTRGEYGTYQQAFQIITTTVALLPLGFGMSAYYFLPRAPDARHHVIQNILLFHAVMGGLALLVFAGLPGTASAAVGNESIRVHGALIGAVCFFWIISGFLETATLANEETVLAPVLIVASQLTKTLLMLGATIWAADVRTLLLAALLHGTIQSIVLFWYLHRRFRGFWYGFDAPLFKRQVTYAAPYSLSALLWVLQTDLHAFFVSNAYGEEMFAIYRIACFQLPFVGLLNESVNAVLIPRVVELQRANRMEEMRSLTLRVARRLGIAFIPLFVMLVVLNREFIIALFTTKYVASIPIFMIFLTLLPTNMLGFDSVARAYPDLARFIFRFRLMLIPVLITGLFFGTRLLDLVGLTLFIVGLSWFERLVIAVRTARTIGMRRQDLRQLADVFKVVKASGVAALATIGLRMVSADWPPIVVLVGGGAVFTTVFVLSAAWLRLATAEEIAMLKKLIPSVRAQPG